MRPRHQPNLDHRIEERLDDIVRRSRALKRRLEHIMSAIDDLTAQVAKNTDVIESAITLIQNIKALLDAAGTDPTKLAELSATLGAEDAKLADAVAANTPAAKP